MSLNTETITQIQTLLQADPALLAQLDAQTELAGVAAVITLAATAQGLDISQADVISHLSSEQSQVDAAAMSDTELEQVVGGFSNIEEAPEAISKERRAIALAKLLANYQLGQRTTLFRP